MSKHTTSNTQNTNGLKAMIKNKNYKQNLTQASLVNLKITYMRETLGALIAKVEIKAIEMKIGKIVLALSSQIFRITTIKDFKKACNEHLKKLQIILHQSQKEIEDSTLINEIIKENHDSAIGGHTGVNRLYGKLKCHYIWPNMKKSIAEYIRNCIKCKENKHTRKTIENFHTSKTIFSNRFRYYRTLYKNKFRK